MDNLITYEVFVGTINIDTGREDVRDNLTDIISETQIKYMEKAFGEDVDYSAYEDDQKIKRMLACFTYVAFVLDQTSSNTPMGNVLLKTESGFTLDVEKLLSKYNEAVEIYEKKRTTSNKLRILNSLGI